MAYNSRCFIFRAHFRILCNAATLIERCTLTFPAAQLSPRSHSLQQQSDGQQSEEYRKLQLNLDTATNYLAANIDPELLATKLLAAGMINRSLVEEAGMNTTAKSKRIRALMYAVLSLVELNSEKYGQFLDILEDMEGLDELVHLLQ